MQELNGIRSKRRSTSKRRRQRPRGRLVLAAAIIASGVAATSVASATAGANEQPWGFEQVSPPGKGGGAITSFDTFRTAPDGNRFLYSATGSFDSVPAEGVPAYVRYIGTRGPDGWSNRGLDPLFEANITGIMTVLGSSADLSHVIVTSTRALAPGATEGGSNLYMRDTRTGALTLMVANDSPKWTRLLANNMGELAIKFVASDGRSALISSSVPLLPGVPDVNPGALYSWTADEGLRAESVLPEADGGGVVGAGYMGRDSEVGVRDALPGDDALKHIFFTSFEGGTAGPVYMRTDGVTQAVSVSQIPGDSTVPVPAQVDAVGKGGRYVLFHTKNFNQRLTTDTPAPGGVDGYAASSLYRYDAQADSLTYVGPLSESDGRGVIQMSGDGQTVVYQGKSAATEDAVSGEWNMYVWRSGTTRFVETADSSSAATDQARFLRVLSPDGRYFSFTDDSSSVAQRFGVDNVSASCPAPDTNTPGPCSEVYLFDADADGGAGDLSCVSCRTDGKPPKGNSGEPDNLASGFMRMDGRQATTVTDDGSVFFTTRDDLLPSDGNGASDVYAYRGGELRLISRGLQNTSARFLDATPDGKTVFISTNDAIVGTDTDRAVDVYMTRAGAGFPYTPPDVAPPCAGADCRGPFAAPGLPESPVTGRSGIPDANPKQPAEPRATVKVTKSSVKGNSLRLTVRTSGRGRIRVSGKTVEATTRTANRAGTYVVSASLTKKTRKALAKSSRLRTQVRVSFTPSFGRAAVTTYRRTVRK